MRHRLWKHASLRTCGRFPPNIRWLRTFAKNGLARLTGTGAPSYLKSFDAAALTGSEDRQVEIKFPNGMGYQFDRAHYLTGFALPNFFFHATTA